MLPEPKYNHMVEIATAHSRLSKKWKNKQIRWGEFLQRCSSTKRTDEIVSEYMRMSRDEQSSIKDVGGFVGGYLAGGVRKTANVLYRTMVTLDIDYGTPDVWDDFTMQYDCAAMIYSTHKHTPDKPRLRLVLPADRQMSPAEYEPVCRYWTSRIGIELFDHTTYQLPRLFYWPSTSRDGEFVFEWQDGPAFCVDDVLATYRDPQDVSEWPMSSRESEVLRHEMRKAGDPTEKPGLIGAFCRAYSIEDAIDKFLPEVYDRTVHDGRYTYRAGSVAGGLVVYDGKFAYSHHDTDPASRRLCNSFDLVRIHLFGIEDEGTEVREITRMPSYLRMQEFAAADAGVRKLIARERRAEASDDFAGIDLSCDTAADVDDWTEQLDYDRKGNMRNTMKNFRIIMLNDPNFRTVRFDLFSQRDTLSGQPNPFAGTHAPDEVDDTSLSKMCAYLSEVYHLDISVNTLMEKMLKQTAPERSYHAVRDFITREKWDGVPRVDTLLIDYLGAEDTPLVRAVTRKWVAAAVGRAIDTDPDTGEGIKFDYCLVLFGEQGTGKSTFAETLAGRWRGSISLADGKKEQCETLRNAWITEIPEFKGMRNADTDAVKDLISRRSDDFRAAYARQWNKNPRHSVFIGSTNNEHFLKDTTGNRRFWIVRVTGGSGVASWVGRLRTDVGQIWAEAYHIYKSGEKLMLPPELEQAMNSYAEDFNEAMSDPLRDYLSEWLDIPLPADWDTYEPKKRVDYYRYFDPLEPVGSIRRDSVAMCEIVTLCPYPGITKCTPNRLNGIMKSIGWIKEKTRKRIPTNNGQKCVQKRSTSYLRPQSETTK